MWRATPIRAIHTQPPEHHRANTRHVHLQDRRRQRQHGHRNRHGHRAGRRPATAPFARDDFADTSTDKPVTINVLANDSDPSGGTPHLVGDPVCTNDGKAVANSDQGVTFDPPAGQNGTFRCKYRVANSQGLPAEAWIIVTVTSPPAGNHDPILTAGTANQTVEFGQSLALAATTFATDIDNDTLVFASMSKQGVGTTNFTQNAQSFSYTAPVPGSADAIPTVVNLDVTISDGHNGLVRQTISIKLTAPAAAVAPTPLTHDISRSATLGLPLPPIDVPTELREQNPGVTLSLQSAVPDPGSALASISAPAESCGSRRKRRASYRSPMSSPTPTTHLKLQPARSS